MRLFLGWCAVILAMVTLGCERFEAPSEAQCEAALKNGLSINMGTAPDAKPAEGQKPDFLQRVKGALKEKTTDLGVSAFKLTDDYKERLYTCSTEWSVHVATCYTAGKSETDLAECKNWPWDDPPARLAQ